METGGKEEGVKDAIDKISADIAVAGGKVETVQKMDKKTFTRVADKKHTSGFYVNVIFECDAAAVAQLRHKFGQAEEVFRVIFTSARAEKTAVAA